MRSSQELDQKQEVPETILDQLKQSKIHSLPFFAYTGIKAYNLEGNDTLYLKSIPRNKGGITGVQITYDYGSDTYKLWTFTKNQRVVKRGEYPEVYFDQLAEIIAREMKVY